MDSGITQNRNMFIDGYLSASTTDWSLDFGARPSKKPPAQLLKWIGNKQRFAQYIASVIPDDFGQYIEPFLGSGAVLGAVKPKNGVAGDVIKPLIDLWNMVKNDPERLYTSYEHNWNEYMRSPRATYAVILSRFNASPNPEDFLFISRACYGGVIRFTKQGKMSTPVGPHKPISPETFRARMLAWRKCIKGTKFIDCSYPETMNMAKKGDVVYCDPPYVDSQAILYGAQAFKFQELLKEVEKCKRRGVKVALSIDGFKKSKQRQVELNLQPGLFERELIIDNGSSMLKRFQKKDQLMIGEDVHDLLLLTW
ncbi:MAG TPA: Dam family site-specific DNA-(adenine-N6)-methyltransferase [Candidatus Saccharimonadales bacterium]|nr:Dam family site-specific DNA-(adenine-N6)-methyltransferase [Candidatus Saccharimonadales bacterium]